VAWVDIMVRMMGFSSSSMAMLLLLVLLLLLLLVLLLVVLLVLLLVVVVVATAMALPGLWYVASPPWGTWVCCCPCCSW
jgi:hypothetical protein